MFACGADLTVLENFIYSDTPTPRALGNLLDRILRLGESFDVSVYDLSVSCDIRTSVIATLLAYLENDGILEATGSFHGTYRLKLLRGQVLAGRSAAEAKFLSRLLECGQAGRTWLSFEPSVIAATLGVRREKITAALGDLAAAGDAALTMSGLRHGFHIKQPPGEISALAARYAEIFQRREEADLARLRQVLGLSAHRGCLTGYLTSHFGEKLADPCGHCDRCRGVPATVIRRPPVRTPDDSDWQGLRELVRENHPQLATPRQLARFLCGMSSPAATRARLQRHCAFGMLDDLPFAGVLAMAEAM
jgi:ATP-dependent DNA helicase RecQ